MKLPHIGDVFEGRYELREVLGQGGFATVYRAYDSSMARDVVIKLLSAAPGGDAARIRSRFLREARVFAEFQDPHIITMFDHGSTADGLLFMVFQFVAGRDLSQVLMEQGPLPPDVVVHILLQLLSALQEAHSRGVLHRDIKPANIIIHTYGEDVFQAKLIDFGIAKDTSPEASSLTKTGGIVGTLRYMAPEQFAAAAVGPDTDIFCLGLVAAEMLTGQPVISGSSQREFVTQHVSDAPLHVPESAAPPELRAIIDRMLQRDRVNRFPTASSVALALRPPRAEPTEPAAPEPMPTSTDGYAPSARPSIVILGVVALALSLCVVGIFAFRTDEEAAPRVVALPMAKPPPVAPLQASTTEDVADISIGGPCERPPPFEGFGKLSFVQGRHVSAYIPKGSEGTRLPVVLMFHRLLSGGRGFMTDAQIPRIADEHRFVAISYGMEGPMGWRSSELADVVEDLELMSRDLCVDRHRVYAIGDEGGAMMATRLPCRTPISGYAVGFDRGTQGCKPLVATARMRFYGARDKHVPVEGGISCGVVGGPAPPVATMNERWREIHECSGAAKPWGQEFEGGVCVTWDCALAPFVSCETDGGHYWPGTRAPVRFSACNITPPKQEFPLPDAVWAFFDREGHTMTDAELARGGNDVLSLEADDVGP